MSDHRDEKLESLLRGRRAVREDNQDEHHDLQRPQLHRDLMA